MRPPEVFVRSLSHEEALRLKRLVKRSKHASTRERASIVLGSNAGNSATAIAASRLTDPNHVRKVIHEFNERGFDSLRPNDRGGRPRRITCDQRKRIVSVAGARGWNTERMRVWAEVAKVSQSPLNHEQSHTARPGTRTQPAGLKECASQTRLERLAGFTGL